ncbi:undecaprenyldiphospho-muramoylpentapeptide beta-N-acetylglucosaminyltransferase [Desulfovibrio sp. OttesenSCG-928-G15]|nr:undecaprenyldiphospho-muramoylpentapeptide beta-N-acetylglucosaminyltransferase [Desulfovibrio sp. OttesenSCG-928-G15]
MQRVILTTGGTGGHIFPALAVAEEIRRKYPGASIVFMGGEYGQEADLAVKAGLDFVGLPVRGVMGRGIRGVGAAFAMLGGVVKALGVMRKTKPEIVIGFGGYAAFAGVSAARLANIPTALHEQNSYPGMTNRVLGKIVDKVFLSMPDIAGVFPAQKRLVVGNPVRSGIVELYTKRMTEAEHTKAQAEQPEGGTSYFGGVDGPSPFDVAARRNQPVEACGQGPQPSDGQAPEISLAKESSSTAPLAAAQGAATTTDQPLHLLVMGGSLGARAINDCMAEVAPALLERDVQIRHQTGKADYERMRAAYRDLGGEKLRVEPFIGDMTEAYAWADLVFCRAGASSLAEITVAGLPAILTPFPQAAQDHQRHNARYLVTEGAAVLLEQEDILRSPSLLTECVLSLKADRQRLFAMAGQSLSLARPHAAATLVDEAQRLVAASAR